MALQRRHAILLLGISLVSFFTSELKGAEADTISVGAGYLDAGCKHSWGVLELEYKWGKRFWRNLRPQATLVLPGLRSLFIGGGIGWELTLSNKISLTPSVEVGLYYRGRGKNLGYPIEFRSSIDLSYQLTDKNQIGFQAFHISNAHLGSKNPGLNAYLFYFAFSID
jgi:lipid A 3-O-deacylase